MASVLEVIVKGTDHASGVFKKVDDSAGGMTKALKIAGLAALGGVAALGTLAVAGAKFVNAASDLEESVNKSKVVFGEFASKIKDFAQTSAQSFGISRTAANSYAATLGTILKGSGLTQEASANMSIDLVKLAADMASFNNIPIGEALEKIRAGLVGESEPLRTVGVLLSEAAVQEEAYASGIAATGDKLTDQQKVQARYNLILKQTSDTQGDFTRTSGGLANQQRILAAEWENIQAILGRALMPTVTRLAQTLTKFLAEHEKDIERISEDWGQFADETLPKVVRAFGDVVSAAQKVTGAVHDVDEGLDVLGPNIDLINLKGGILGQVWRETSGDLDVAGVKLEIVNTKGGLLGQGIGELSKGVGALSGEVDGLGGRFNNFSSGADDASESAGTLEGTASKAAEATGIFADKMRAAADEGAGLPASLQPAKQSIDDITESANEARDALFKMFKEPTQEEEEAEAVLAKYKLELAKLTETSEGAEFAEGTRGATLKNYLIPTQERHLDVLRLTRDAALEEAEAKHKGAPTQEAARLKWAEQTATLEGLKAKMLEVSSGSVPVLSGSIDDQRLRTQFLREEVQNYIAALGRVPSRISTALELKLLKDSTWFDIKTGATGWHGEVTKPTFFLAGEAGRERVDITPNGSMASGGSGGATYVFNLSYQGEASMAAAERFSKRVIAAVRRELRH